MTSRRNRSALASACTATFAALLLAGCGGNDDPAAVVAEARQLVEAGETGEARIELKKLLSKDGTVVAARVMLARIALDAGDVRVADTELSGLDATQLSAPQVVAIRSWVDLGLGEHEKVIKTLDSTTAAIDPVELVRLRATAMRAAGAGADALPLLRAAQTDYPNDGLLAVEVAATLAAIGNLRQAEQEVDAFLQAHPKQVDALQVRGELRMRNGATAKAVEDLTAALAAAPPSWPPVKRITTELLLGDAALAAGNVAQAKERVASLNNQFPGALGTELLAARITLIEGRSSEAAESLQRIAEAMPDNQRVQALLVDALLRSGNRAQASTLLEKRVQQEPNDGRARRLLAELLMQQSRPDRVVALLGEVPEDVTRADAEEDTLLSTARVAQERADAAISTLQTKLTAEPGNSQLRIELATAYLQSGQPTRGLTVLTEAKGPQLPAAAATELALHFALSNDREVNRVVTGLLEDRDTSVKTLLAAADAAHQAGRNDVLARLVDRALELDANDTAALLRRANLDFIERRYDTAATTLDKVIKLKPQDSRARIARARVAEAKGDVDAARATLREAMRATPTAPEAGLMLAGLELRAEQTPAALAALDSTIAAAPKDGAAANAAGSLLLRSRHAEEARARYGQAVEQNPKNARYWFNLARAQVLANDRDAAAQSFERAAALQPEWFDANVASIRLMLELKRVEAARTIAQGLVERMREEPRAWLVLGDVEMAGGKASEAIAAFSRSYALKPTASAAVREHVSRAASQAPRAEQPLLTWLAREPNDLTVRRRLADFYQRTGADKLAVEQLTRILDTAPNDVASLNNLAWLLASSDPNRAETLARRATSIVPNQAALADTLGWVLINARKYPEATKVLERAARDMPQDRSVRYRYALALARSGDKAGALREVQSALADGAAFDSRNAAQQLSQELGS